MKVNTHLSVMATCSNMADPVLLFQFPEMEVRLKRTTGFHNMNAKKFGERNGFSVDRLCCGSTD